MQTHYFYTAIITFSVGVGVATFWEMSSQVIMWLVLLAFVSLSFWFRSKFTKEITGWLIISIILAGFTFGTWRTEFAKSNFGHSELEKNLGEKIELVGVVAKEPDRRENSLRLFVRVGEDLVLVTTDRYALITYGNEVKVEGKLSKPENFTTEFGRTFNYSGYLLAQGTEYQISFAKVEVINNNLGNPFIAKLLIFKSAFMYQLEKAITEPAVGLGEGLLLGVKQALGEELEDAFRETGIIHIVVLSGYNVMLVVAFVMYVLGYFLSVRLRVIAGIIAIISFALLVGLSATVVRASIMASILLIAQATGRLYLVLRVLLFAGFVMLLFNPLLLIYDVGFQLSFLATLGLILLAPILEQYFSKVPSFAGMRLFLTATIATQIAVLPLLLYQIGQLSAVAIVVNLLVLPMVPVAMLLTFATGMFGFVSSNLAWLVAFPTYWSLTYINNLALWFADLPMASFVVPTFAFYIVPISYFIMGIIWWRLYKPEYGMGYGEMAEQLIKVDDKNTEVGSEKTKVTDEWVIEEEKDEINTKGSDAKRPTPKEDIPIFFR
jgi:competence protein ComEC